MFRDDGQTTARQQDLAHLPVGFIRLGRKMDNSTSGQVASDLQQKYQWLDRPFIDSKNQSKETIAFANYFLSCIAKGKKRHPCFGEYQT